MRLIMHLGRNVLVVFLLVTGFSLDQQIVIANDDTLVMGVFPRRNFTQTIEMFTPMAEHLSRELGQKVKLESARNFREFWEGVKAKHYDIVHYNQYHYVESRMKYGYEVILKNEEFGKATIEGALVVRKDSGISSLKDLRGKKIVFGGGRMAMVAYVIPTALLMDVGLKEGSYEKGFAKNPPNALLAAFFKQADAGGVGSIVMSLPSLVNKVDMSQLAILVKSEPVTHLPWAVKGSMSAERKKMIQSVLTKLKDGKEGQEILKTAKLTNLLVATDDEYNPHRRIIRRVSGESF